MSSEHDASVGSAQYTWLVNDLNRVNRTLTPWLVVELHRPLYNGETFWSDNAVGIGMRKEFEHLLHGYRVDVVFAGHYHSYFRTCDGLFQSQCDNHGPTHITIGTAGASLEHMPFYKTHWSRMHILQHYGYGRVTVINATALHFEFIKAGSSDDETAGTVLDEVWIIRPHQRV
jgi:acid phosphatase type 7